MSLTVTLAGLGAFGLLFLAANLLSRRPPEPGKVRLLPYEGIQFVALVGVVLLLAHLIGLVTGQPVVGRFGP